jgi:hypothetical protein
VISLIDLLQARLRQLRSLEKAYATQWRAVILTLGVKWRMDDCTCQRCIAKAIGSSRAHVSLVLKRVGGLWTWNSARWGGHHPSKRNGPTRGKQYALTTAGWGAFGSIVDTCDEAPSDAIDPWLSIIDRQPGAQSKPRALPSPSPSIVRSKHETRAHDA